MKIVCVLCRYYAFNGANGLMCMAPIMLFLGRVNKKVWAGYKVVVMNWLIAVASILQSAMALYRDSTPAFNIMSDLSVAFMAMALAFYVLNVVVMTVRQQMKWRRRQRRRAASMADTATETNTITTAMTDDLDETEKAVNHDIFVAHSFNQLLLLVVNVVWFALTPTEVGITTVFCIYIAVAGCVLLVEMRVRKSEIQHGLAQLSNKRAFVRYCHRALLLLARTIALPCVASDHI
jgi:ABC-type multidrug transport system fused ATPase/permease subunit